MSTESTERSICCRDKSVISVIRQRVTTTLDVSKLDENLILPVCRGDCSNRVPKNEKELGTASIRILWSRGMVPSV